MFTVSHDREHYTFFFLKSILKLTNFVSRDSFVIENSTPVLLKNVQSIK